MSYFDDASLVMIPSGYKTSKVYSVKPTDGTGDLTFTRSLDTATRVGPDGLIEKVRTNLLTYSQDFTSAAGWSVIGGSVATTANFGVAPDGTTTSTRLVFSGASEIWAKSVSGATGIGVFSLFIKGTAGETILITYGGIADKTITLGAGWNRFNTDGNAAISTQMFINTYGGATARDIEVWGGQVELGDIATPYIPTTTAAVSVGMLANVPRLDYTGGGCPRLLLEPQRTNVLTFSEAFDNAIYTKTRLTISANTSASPDGFTSADSVFETTDNNTHELFQRPEVTATQPFTFSCFVKANGRRRLHLQIFDNAALFASALFDVISGVVIATSGTSKIENYGNGWYRCTITGVSPTTATGYAQIALARDTYTDATVLDSYVGDVTKGVLLYGAQGEANASYATSYIPTLGAAVTRSADAASKTGISALIGQTEGTLFFDAVIDAFPADNSFYGVEKTASNFVIRFGSGGSSVYAQVYNGSTNLFFEPTSYTLGTRVKLAFAYKAGSYAFYKNGTLVATGANATAIPACDSIMTNSLWGNTGNGKHGISQALLFKTRLTNAQLAELTA